MTHQRENRPVGSEAVSKESGADSCQPTPSRAESAWYATPIPMADREIGDQRYHTAPVGFGARTFREGFARGGRDALRRIWSVLPADLRGQIAVIAADYEDNDQRGGAA